MYLVRADELTENALLEKVIEIYGTDRGMKAYYKMRDDGTPVINENGRRAMTPMSDEEVNAALNAGKYLCALN